jgi:osmotically-inducible protein OsmY
VGTPSIPTSPRHTAVSPVLARRPGATTDTHVAPHLLERQVRHVLTSHPDLRFSSLEVRRIPQGVCLTGVVESMSGKTDVCELAKQVSGVHEVLNRLLIRAGAPR